MSEERRDELAEGRFADNLRTARERAGLSQQAVAKEMRERGFQHIRQQTIAQIEGGSRSVRLGEALALAEITSNSLYALVRPAGLAHEAGTLITMARAVREAGIALSEAADRLRDNRRILQVDLARIERQGQAAELGDEMFVARRAALESHVALLRALVAEVLDGGSGMAGHLLTPDERKDLLNLAETLLSLAGERGPITSKQEAAWRLATYELSEAKQRLDQLLLHKQRSTTPLGADDKAEG